MRARTVMLLLLIVCLSATIGIGIAACGGGETDDSKAIVGVWTDEQGLMDYEFKSDGALVVTFMGQGDETTYSVKDGKLFFPDPDTGEENQLDFRVEGDKLIMNFDGEEAILVRK